MRSFIAVLLLCLLAAPAAVAAQRAPAAPWVAIHRGVEALVSVDTSRITAGGSTHELWLRFDLASPAEVPDESGKTFLRVDMLEQVDCAAESIQDLRMVMWSPKGARISDEEALTSWNSFREHPFGAQVFPALCGWLADRAS